MNWPENIFTLLFGFCAFALSCLVVAGLLHVAGWLFGAAQNIEKMPNSDVFTPSSAPKETPHV